MELKDTEGNDLKLNSTYKVFFKNPDSIFVGLSLYFALETPNKGKPIYWFEDLDDGLRWGTNADDSSFAFTLDKE